MIVEFAASPSGDGDGGGGGRWNIGLGSAVHPQLKVFRHRVASPVRHHSTHCQLASTLYARIGSRSIEQRDAMNSPRYLGLALACWKLSFRPLQPILQSTSRPAVASSSNTWQAQWTRGMKVVVAIAHLHTCLIVPGADVRQATLRRLQGSEAEEEIRLYNM
jgi:hypothetical protein